MGDKRSDQRAGITVPGNKRQYSQRADFSDKDEDIFTLRKGGHAVVKVCASYLTGGFEAILVPGPTDSELELYFLASANGKYEGQNRKPYFFQKARTDYLGLLKSELTSLKSLERRQDLFNIRNCLGWISIYQYLKEEKKWCTDHYVDISEIAARRS
eukprot:Gregarina_sp_Poly_1__5042@NODE_2672_length_1845_cov_38_084927_g1482_i1_p1_GENE_NODE_2672_length_1845_cov_38_084927_g1482_i1NODE_2672_length_1845_cov_38_084927_g1482_i1_p1_ORF_typecomplete_len157_score21_66_NODE_2672_length_1845_cov_38_084927_g1482_i140510